MRCRVYVQLEVLKIQVDIRRISALVSPPQGNILTKLPLAPSLPQDCELLPIQDMLIYHSVL